MSSTHEYSPPGGAAEGCTLPRAARMVLGVGSAPAFVWLAWWSLLAGASRLASDYGARALDAAELAVRLTPSDPEGHYARAVVLKVEYAGASDPSTPAVSRLAPVEPGARYRLTFSARTRELVTGGPPFVQVASAAKPGQALAAAAPLTASMTGWQDFSLEFDAPRAGAVRVALARQPCTSSPCPAFGVVWLDAFELRRL